MATAGSDIDQEARCLLDVHDVRDEMLADVAAARPQQPYGLGGQTLAVPHRRHPAGNAADLGRPQDETVVVELVTEPNQISSFGVEREVHHRALWAHRA